MTKKFEIRNSTAEFLTFVAENKEDGVQVFYKDETIWATQQAIATLFDKNKSTISRHIAKIYSEGELQPEATVAKFATVVNSTLGCLTLGDAPCRCSHVPDSMRSRLRLLLC